MLANHVIVTLAALPGGLSTMVGFELRGGHEKPLFARLDTLADFFTEAFVICAFVALLTVAILHFLQPLLRKVAQDITLTANAGLPKEYSQVAITSSADESPHGRWLDMIEGALVAVFKPLPAWMLRGDSWSAQDWVRDGMARLEETGRRLSPLSIAAGFVLGVDWKARRFGFRTPSSFLPDELFMRTVESEARAVLAAPKQNPYLFALLTVSAPQEARAVMAYLDDLARVSPSEAAKLATPEDFGQQTAAGIAAAENAVTAAAESWLDRFQLALVTKSLFVSRVTAILAGIALAWMAAGFVGGRDSLGTLAALGAGGGLLGLLANDAARAVFLGRRR